MINQGYQQIQRELAKILAKTSDLERPLFLAAELGRNSILENFRVGGRPEPWKPSVRALLTGGQTLVDTAQLKGSIDYEVFEDAVTFFSDAIHAATHNFGDPERNIVQREFMLLQDVDIKEIEKIFKNHFERLA